MTNANTDTVDNESKPPEFTPNKNQLALLTVCQNHSYRIEMVDATAKIDMSDGIYRKWRQVVPGFSEWWDAQATQFFRGRRHRWYARLERIGDGEDGNPRAVQTLMERFDEGYAPTSRQELTGANGEALASGVHTHHVYLHDAKQPEISVDDPQHGKTGPDVAPGRSITIEPDPPDGGNPA